VEGPAGWGECSPLPGYPCSAEAARAAADEAAVEGWPPPLREEVEVNALVPWTAAAEEAAQAASAAVKAGYRCLKVKVVGPNAVAGLRGPNAVAGLRGPNAVAGLRGSTAQALVAAVREAAGPHVALRVDANGAWDVERAEAEITRLSPYGLEYVEQPVPTLEELADLRRRVTVPVAADECVRTVEDARRLARLGAADVLVVKVQPLGGVRAALRVAEAAGGVPVVVTSMLETSVGLAAGLALAAALPELDLACGLGTASLLAADVVADPLAPEDGRLAVRRPTPDAGLLDRYRVRA
jgi:o-succinylbenzoate synthase